MIDVTGDIEKALNAEMAVIYFTASWCAPCRQLKPLYAKAGMQDELHWYFVIDVDSVDNKYLERYNIKTIPTLFLMNKGEIIKSITARTTEGILEQVNS